MSKRYPGGIIRKTPPTPSQSSAQGIWDMASVTQAVKENNWPIAGVPDPVSRSLRFRSSASAYLNRTPASAGNRKTWTWSAWVKRGGLSSNQSLFAVNNNGADYQEFRFTDSNTLRLFLDAAANNYAVEVPTVVWRDPAAWYHIVLAVDTTQATSTNRVKIYVNGIQQTVTALSGFSLPAQNFDTYVNATLPHAIGNFNYLNSLYFDGYMTEVYLIDGQALTPSSFGNTNAQTGVWQPIAYTGTYGTNGFYLPFSNVTSTTTLGYDFSGNNNNWTANNISLTTGTSIQSFTTTGTTSWTAPTGVTSVNYLVVAGGGGGAYAGGGGAGGMRTGTIPVVPGVSYTVTVGAGGTGGTGFADNALKGSDSVFGSITSTGGGAGNLSYASLSAKNSGGSGGAGGIGTTSSGSGTAGQGNAGGVGDASNAGGGGGAGAAGGNASGGFSGNGGAGSASSISGTSVTYAGGGGGGCSSNSNTNFGSGGSGGGGSSSTLNGSAGTANTGGGGGGASYNGSTFGNGGAGGSGIVILSWASGATTTYDSMVDVPTQWIPYNTTGDVGALWRGNYCVLNPLNKIYSTFTLSNANLTWSSDTVNMGGFGTIQLPTSGKYYWEIVMTVNAGGSPQIGVGGGTDVLGNLGAYYRTNGNKEQYGGVSGNGSSAYGATWTTNDVIGVAYDADTSSGQITFYKNGSSQGVAFSSLKTNFPNGLFAAFQNNNSGTTTFQANFGQRPFVYTPPVGFKTLNTTNLPTPTIGATASTTANKYFDTTLYTGNGTSQSIVNSGSMQPDLVWEKRRDAAQTFSNGIIDSVRGRAYSLVTNLTIADQTSTSTNDLTSFNSNGFSIGPSNNLSINDNGGTYVAWQWRANSGTNVTNTAGTITSTVSANTTAGFSVVTYTGNGTNSTVGHGLGATPSMVIVKCRSTAGESWHTYHVGLSSPANTVYLNGTAAQGSFPTCFNSMSTLNSTLFSLGTDGASNGSGRTYVAYCWAPIAGYSAFGSYTGNGSTDGPFVFTGFRPRWVMVKNITSAQSWQLMDTSRSTYNVATANLLPNSSSAELTGTDFIDMVSNGFKIRQSSAGNWNNSGDTYIYACFAEFPFKFSLAR